LEEVGELKDPGKELQSVNDCEIQLDDRLAPIEWGPWEIPKLCALIGSGALLNAAAYVVGWRDKILWAEGSSARFIANEDKQAEFGFEEEEEVASGRF
jgi:hypothetical protein